MAMTKKELAEFEQMKVMLALRLHPHVEPDLDIPTDDSIVNGYMFNVYTNFVSKACSSSSKHGIGHWDRTTSRDGIKLYSTEKLAYAELLHQKANMFAAEMRSIEIKMEKAIQLNDGV